MAKNISDIDKEKMYRKIMPSAAKKTDEGRGSEGGHQAVGSQTPAGTEPPTAVAMFQALRRPAVNVLFKEEQEMMLVNLMENIVISRLDATLSRFNCCKCNRCKQDIVALALNRMKPRYVVISADDIAPRQKAEEDYGAEATSALVQAILLVKKTPRH